MSKFLKLAGVGLAAAVVIGLAANASAYAQGTPSASNTSTVTHGGFGPGLCSQAGLNAAAEALDMTADDLSAQLWGGKTLAAIAEDAGVDLQTVQAAVTAACTQATRDSIEQAVTDGTLTREHADWLLEGLDKGFWGGEGGFGPGGFHGMGGDGFRGPRGFRGPGAPNGTAPNGTNPNNNATPDSNNS